MLVYICNVVEIIAKFTYILTDRLKPVLLKTSCIVTDYKGYLL